MTTHIQFLKQLPKGVLGRSWGSTVGSKHGAIFSENLRNFMEARGIGSAEKLSELTGIPVGTVKGWLFRGVHPRGKYLDILAEKLGFSEGALTGGGVKEFVVPPAVEPDWYKAVEKFNDLLREMAKNNPHLPMLEIKIWNPHKKNRPT